jgi:protein involved in polysaccharide export with SLBB domain
MLKHSFLLLTAVLFTFSLRSTAQSFPGSSSTDSQQNIDCSDPLNAGLPACQAGANQGLPNQSSPGAQGLQTERSGQNGRPGNGVQQGPTYWDNGGSPANPNTGRLPAAPQTPVEPLTEFQKLLAATTGQVLPIFGHDLFRGVPSTFAPVDQIPVTSDYVIGPGDEVRIRVWGQVNFNADLKVDRSGDIYLPQVGRIHVSGFAFSELSQQIRSQIARVFRNFDLTVDLGQLRSIQIFVVGQARRPGAYTVSSLSTLVNALFASGGPSVQGSMRDIQLKREGKVISNFDLYDLLIRGDKSKDARLLPGDVIFIPAVGPEVALTGSVRKPAIYELNPEQSASTIQQLLDSAGGLSSVASNSRLSVERIEDHQARQAMEIALDSSGLGTPLQDGDVVRVLSIVPAFEKTVTIRGNLANPGRFAWHEGMKLSDLIPDRPSLITRDYWWRRAKLGLPGPEFQPLEGRGILGQPAVPMNLPQQRMPTEATGISESNQPSQPDVMNQPAESNQQDYPPYGQSPSSNQLSTQQSTNGNFPSSPQRTVPLSAQAESSGATLAGQQSQVVTQNVASAGPKTDVTLSAPEIDWSYAVIERLNPVTLKTSLISFNLGKLVIDHDATQDLILQPGDVVSIFSQADIRVPLDQQTKFVRLEGEFVGAGIYSVQPGETLRDLVLRAGGFSPGAYLFGSEFTRESTRVFQQQRLDEYIQSLELQIPRQGLALAAAAVSPQDTAAANTASISQQALLSKLHQLRATGRIVLEVKPNSTGLDSIPNLPLQDGDRFVVPPVPASVNVVGAVYDQNSFLFQGNRRIGDYLRLAGGPNRDADQKHIFVIRADGSVFSRESANGLWGNNFEATKLNPGDSIIVPEKVIGSSVLRGFVNWSQVFSQLALGAAAISVLHN